MKKNENRAVELDILRGCAVILMILDHFMYNLWGLLPGLFDDYPRALRLFAMSYWEWDVRHAVRVAVIFVFLGLTGVCCSFSRSNLKRGGKLLAVAMGLTLVTFLVGKFMDYTDLTIAFGVLHAIALSLLLVGLLEKLHTHRFVYLVLGLLLCAVGGAVCSLTGAPRVSYASDGILVLLGKAMLGIVSIGSDCFDLLTTCGQIFLGVFFGKQFYTERNSLFGWKYRNNVLTFLGRNSLWVYMAHQILLPVLTVLVLLCMGYSLAL